MNSVSADDYIASRCCFLNGLVSQGYILAEQAIEKLLKSAIWLLDPAVNLRGKHSGSHNVSRIFEKYISLSGDVNCEYGDLCKTLEVEYSRNRYPDNNNTVGGGSIILKGDFVFQVDSAYIYFFDRLNVPERVKYRIGIMGVLFFSRHELEQKWLLERNEAISKNIDRWRVEFRELGL